MIVKRYHVATMAEAMSTIRAELGPDAVILSSKPVRKKGLLGFFKKKDLEVIAAYEPRLESPKAREETAAKVLRQTENKSAAIPPIPGAAMGHAELPTGSHTVNVPAGRAASAYRNASVTSSSLPVLTPPAQEARPAPPTQEEARGTEAATPSGDTTAIREALAAALAARGAARKPAAAADVSRQESERFVPLSPPEMVITGPGAEERISPAAPTSSSERLDALEERLSAIAEVISLVADRMGEGEIPLSTEASSLYKMLAGHDVEEKFARTLAKEAQLLAPRIGGTVNEAAMRLLLRELRESAPLQFEAGKRTVLVFMGPTGVGKTTTLVKLATMCAVRNGLKVGMINTDTYRIAAQEQLRIYADILAVPQEVVYSPGEMAAALKAMSDREVIFVDTAGKRPGDPQHREDMAALLESVGSEAQVLLCVAAPVSPRALRDIADHYSFLADYGLILTKTDEVSGLGAAINACAFSGKSLHYLTSGQSVPDDIEEVDARAIAERLLA